RRMSSIALAMGSGPAVALTTFGVGAFVFLAAGSATATPVVPEAELTAGLLVLGLIAAPGPRVSD
ncbi:hypothetical protein, partial [Serratia marcescens]|uniref:hypothetical protein n=1 Tax=Serratia marcescens TaxID=615 RepID=UPI001953DCCD